MRKGNIAAALLAAPVLIVGGWAPAYGGEVTGPPSDPGGDGFATGGPTGIFGHANSECAFSGQNAFHPGKPGAMVQSYGAFVSQGLKDQFPSPGDACNGHTAGMK